MEEDVRGKGFHTNLDIYGGASKVTESTYDGEEVYSVIIEIPFTRDECGLRYARELLRDIRSRGLDLGAEVKK